MESTKTVLIDHPFNANLRYRLDLPIDFVEGGVPGSDALEELVERVKEDLKDKRKQADFQTQVDEIYQTSTNKYYRALLIYQLVLKALNRYDPEMDLSTTENVLFDLYKDVFTNQPRIFEEEEEEEERVPGPGSTVFDQDPGGSEFVSAEIAVYRALRPLYLFIDILNAEAGSSGEFDHYLWRGEKKPLRFVKSPVMYRNISSEAEFREKNYFLGEPVLDFLLSGEKVKKSDLEWMWRHFDVETFEHILAGKTLGAIMAGYNNLNDKHGTADWRPYVASPDVNAKFARYVGLHILMATGGNAYPYRITGNRTTYAVSSGIQTRNLRAMERAELKLWLEDKIYKETKTGLLRKS